MPVPREARLLPMRRLLLRVQLALNPGMTKRPAARDGQRGAVQPRTPQTAYQPQDDPLYIAFTRSVCPVVTVAVVAPVPLVV